MRSVGYILGFCVGLAVPLIIGFVIFRLLKRRNPCSCTYDERQEVMRGRAFRHAYFTLLIYLVICAVFDACTGIRWAEPYTLLLLGMLISLAVFVGFSIHYDAYFQVGQHIGKTVVVFILLGLINLAAGVKGVLTGTFVVDGMLSMDVISPLMGLFLLILAVVALCKSRRSKRREEDEE